MVKFFNNAFNFEDEDPSVDCGLQVVKGMLLKKNQNLLTTY